MTATNTFCNSTTRKLPRTKIVDDAVLPRIHEATVKLLKETGVIFEHDEALEVFKRHGAGCCTGRLECHVPPTRGPEGPAHRH